MKHQDWEAHRNMLHQHDNQKFAKLTPREGRPADDEDFWDQLVNAVIVISCAALLVAVIALLLAAGVR